MAQISAQALESMARIGYSEKPFTDYLDVQISELQESIMFQTDDVQLRILQGRAQELHRLRKLIKEAPDMARKA